MSTLTLVNVTVLPLILAGMVYQCAEAFCAAIGLIHALKQPLNFTRPHESLAIKKSYQRSGLLSDEVVEVAALQRIFFESEVFVGAQVVDPELVCPWFFGCRFVIEEEDVGVNASPARTALGVDAATCDLPPEN